MSRPGFPRRALLVAPLVPLSAPAVAQSWPSRQVRFVVPFTAGGSLDVVARMISPRMQELIGQGAIIDNRPGGGTIIGTDAVAKLPADGYAALLIANSFTINATLIRNPPFDARREFTGVSFLAFNPHVLIAAPRLGVSTVAEVVAAAKSRHGLTYASSGTGTSLHLGGESFRAATGAPMTHVPYRGSPQAITDVFNGQVDLMFANMADAIPAIRDGRVKAIAVADASRQPLLPETPTFDEVGVHGVVSNSWFGMVARSDVPAPILDKLHDTIAQILAEPESIARLTQVGLTTRPMSRPAFNAFLVEEFERNGRIIRENGITVD
ncbi:Bug family tripartite tricarboxylate transporter substrate binding protein [Roseococcus sp. YIM B11640]|uniref:Bug family tripartite tricarboxylate transporter substrate binding protein n=1 Tax=Roseococcus sp. YIM B11640 TaxID=3133973 RepID=UPI003C79B1EB